MIKLNQNCHPCESRDPELIKITRFRILAFARKQMCLKYKKADSKIHILLTTLIICTLATSCATGGRKHISNMFEEDLVQTQELIKNDNLPNAIGELSMLLEMDPKNQDALFLRALAYQKMQHFNKAINDYNKILEINKNNSKAHYNLGMIYGFQLLNPSLALKHFDVFITLNPKHPSVFNIAKIMLKLDNDSDTNTSEKKEIRAIIEDTLTQNSLLRAETKENLKEKEKLLAEALKTSPDSGATHFAFAKTLQEQGNLDAAKKQYLIALELKPTFAECHYMLGQLLLKANKKEEADIHLLKASLFEKGSL
ncbi:MAG: hypothetical protein COS89_00870 [Deltaproteobacteria bacterium CG07_land_8_20_14_0_80_38_7]|nr:MAG: hypothetical protein COS89_00870 [Deltaproteobacteria bacterium CG07_land_8_20_14_0_80_38_7]